MNNVRDIVICALLSAVLVISKELLAFLPNLELVSFLILVYARHLKLTNSLVIVNVFCLLEIVLYGIGLWTLPYFVAWNFWMAVHYFLRNKVNRAETLAFISGVFGLFFDVFFSFPYFMMSWSSGWAYLIQGMFFSCIHAVGNYLMMLILFDPVNKWMQENMKDKY